MFFVEKGCQGDRGVEIPAADLPSKGKRQQKGEAMYEILWAANQVLMRTPDRVSK